VKAYFDLPAPRVIAHRGLAIAAPENTALAFMHALAIGVRYLETDVHASSDGEAMISHDPDLRRLAGRTARIGDLTAAELSEVELGEGQRVLSLAAALDGFPDGRFNIDIKDPAAVEPTVRAVLEAKAIDRVLITSFDEGRRTAAVERLPGVATSASARRFVPALLSGHLGSDTLLRRALRGIDAVQIPERALGLPTTGARFIDRFHAIGVEVHIWTVNDPVRMAQLLGRGVDGLVTDRADLAISQVARDILPGNPL